MVFIGFTALCAQSISVLQSLSSSEIVSEQPASVRACRRREHMSVEQQCHVVLLFTLGPVTHKHTYVLACNTAAQCLLLKVCSHDSAE